MALEIDQWLVDQNGKATQTKWKDGRVSGIPFYVDQSLSDFDGDQGAYIEYLNGLGEMYLQERNSSPEGKPLKTTFPNYDSYESALRVWEHKEAMKEFQKENAPPPQPQISFPRDENRVKRIELYTRQHELEEKLQAAKRSGDRNLINLYEDQIRWNQKDIEAIPESKFQTDSKKLMEGEITALVGALFDPNLKNHPMWEDENVRHNAAAALEDFNQRVPGSKVIYPMETSYCSGKLKEIRPGNVKEFDLGTQEAKDRFLYNVKIGAKPHDLIRGQFGRNAFADLDDDSWEVKQKPERPSEESVHEASKTDPFAIYEKPQKAYEEFVRTKKMPEGGKIYSEEELASAEGGGEAT